MTSPLFKKAERKQAKLRLGISGPAGSGKTFSALQIAFGIGGRIAVIDTEHSSAELYAHLGDYDVAVLDPPFTVQKYLETIRGAEAAGYSTIIIDSLSHAWAGEGGLLDQQGALANRGVNSYTAWRDITPMHTQLIEAMLQSPAHIIATMRSKTDYVLQENGKGKMAPIKVGMAPVQREGMDYEFTVVFDMGLDHTASVSKDRTSLFAGQYFRPDRATGELLRDWLTTGAAAPAPCPVPSAIAEPKVMTKKQPAEKCHTPGKTAPADPTKCAQCGIPQEEAPGGWLVVADDGRRVCATCRNAGAQAELQVEKTPEIGAGFVCEECAKQLTNSEQKASKMLLSRALCKDCMQKWTAEEGIGA